MKITLYGLPMCQRCKAAKMMLEKRKELLEKRNIVFENIELTINDEKAKGELPILTVDTDVYTGKDVLLFIRTLKE